MDGANEDLAADASTMLITGDRPKSPSQTTRVVSSSPRSLRSSSRAENACSMGGTNVVPAPAPRCRYRCLPGGIDRVGWTTTGNSYDAFALPIRSSNSTTNVISPAV